MATAPWFVLSPNALLSTIGLLRGPDKTVPTPAEDWRAAVVDVAVGPGIPQHDPLKLAEAYARILRDVSGSAAWR